jgi:hypothetical protein
MSTTSLLLLVAATVLFAGLVKMVFGLLQAPEGYEDANGFHQFVDSADASTDSSGFVRGLGNAKMM